MSERYTSYPPEFIIANAIPQSAEESCFLARYKKIYAEWLVAGDTDNQSALKKELDALTANNLANTIYLREMEEHAKIEHQEEVDASNIKARMVVL